jgi:hypothetical protein
MFGKSMNNLNATLFFLSVSVIGLFTATNPDYAVPLIPEIGLIGLSIATSLFSYSWRGLERTQKHFFLAAAALISILIIRYGINWTTEFGLPVKSCLLMPSVIPKLECVFQQEFSQNYGARQILVHITALFVAFATCSLARSKSAEFILIRFVSLSVIVSIVCIFGSFEIIDRPIVGYNWVASVLPKKYGTILISNHGWLWPLLTPALAAAMGLLIVSERRVRVFAWASLALVSYACLATRQRGAYLIFSIFAFILFSHFLYSHWASIRQPFRRFSPKNLAVMALFVFVVSLIFFPSVQNVLNLNTSKMPYSVSHERLTMWKYAFSGVGDSLFLGRGYSSWMSEIAKIMPEVERVNLSYPTAHNFWIQALFELGLIHFSLILLFWSWIVYKLLFQNKLFPSIRLFAIAMVCGAFCVTLVQEIDHIGWVYYQFAAGLGIILGSGLPAQRLPSGAECKKDALYGRLVAGSTFLVVCFLCLQQSWGGYSFGVHLEGKTSRFNRAFRPYGMITAFPTKQNFAFSVFRFIDRPTGSFEIEPIFTNSLASSDGSAIILQNGFRKLGTPYFYQASEFNIPDQRAISFRMVEPPLQTDLGLFKASGLLNWEASQTSPGTAEIWCTQDCHFDLWVKPTCKNPGIILRAPRPDLNAENILHVKLIQQGREDLAQSVEFVGADTKIVLPLQQSQNDYWIRNIKIEPSHSFNPQRSGFSQDNRDLGVMITDLHCD